MITIACNVQRTQSVRETIDHDVMADAEKIRFGGRHKKNKKKKIPKNHIYTRPF